MDSKDDGSKMGSKGNRHAGQTYWRKSKKAFKEAQNKWMEEQCEEIDAHPLQIGQKYRERPGQPGNWHKKTKTI